MLLELQTLTPQCANVLQVNCWPTWHCCSALLQVMFLFTDAHVANESFLELINNMLTSGMIPALYDDGEKDALIAGIREEVPQRLLHT